MNKRIVKLRKELNLTQQAFADRIGVKRGAIANYEIGRNAPTDSVCSLICREFDVSEAWLRDGTGEMFVPASDDILDKLAAEYKLNRSAYIVVEKFIKLRPEEQEQILRYFTAVVDELRKESVEP